jgi:hypothetical protein
MEDNKNSTFKGSLEGYIKIVQELLPDNKQVTIRKDGYEMNTVSEKAKVSPKSTQGWPLEDGLYRMNFSKVGDPS